MTAGHHEGHGDGHERRYGGELARLRGPERLALLEVDRVVELCLEGLAAESVLDVGAGTGLWAEAFARRGLRATGIDVKEEMVAEARRLVPQAEFTVGAMESLPWPDRSFDLVFLGHVLHEADDVVAALREARRTAKSRVAALEWPYRTEEHGPPLAHRLTTGRVEDAARAAGITCIDHRPLAHMVLYLFR